MIKTDTRAAFREVRTGERSRNEFEERRGRGRVFQAAAGPRQKPHNGRGQGPAPRPETPPRAGPERREGGTGPRGPGRPRGQRQAPDRAEGAGSVPSSGPGWQVVW